jgi:hypothetical protein
MAIFSRRLRQPGSRFWTLLILVVGIGCPSFAQSAESRNGSIYLIDKSGRESRLTESGQDAEPNLSAKGDQVAYVRTRPSTEAGADGAVSEIRVHNVISGTDEIVLQGPAVIDGKQYYGFGHPQFAPDARKVFFLFNWAATTHGLASLDPGTHEVKFLMPAVAFPAVVLHGKYTGDLVVQQRRPKLGVGYYLLYYLFTPDGKEIGVVGDKEFDVEIFLDPDGDLR